MVCETDFGCICNGEGTAHEKMKPLSNWLGQQEGLNFVSFGIQQGLKPSFKGQQVWLGQSLEGITLLLERR